MKISDSVSSWNMLGSSLTMGEQFHNKSILNLELRINLVIHNFEKPEQEIESINFLTELFPVLESTCERVTFLSFSKKTNKFIIKFRNSLFPMRKLVSLWWRPLFKS